MQDISWYLTFIFLYNILNCVGVTFLSEMRTRYVKLNKLTFALFFN